jgi:outer membrane protein
VNSTKVLRTAALVAACLLSTAAIKAQGAAAAGTGAAGKIGVISVRQAIVSTAEGKQASAELQSQFAPRQNELEGLNKQLTDIRQKLSLGDKLSQDEQARLTRQGEVLTRQLERKQQEYQEDVNAAQGDVAVFDSSAQNTPILFASTSIDLTQDIVRLYDQAYPIKGGTAEKPKTTPKPAAAQPPAAKP